jgi:hypothetical protein
MSKTNHDPISTPAYRVLSHSDRNTSPGPWMLIQNQGIELQILQEIKKKFSLQIYKP